jgi:nucleoside-diphosphate-sugar epimerase
MKINIIGGNGLVGNGIASALAKNHDIRVFGSSDFDRSTLKFKTSDVFDCDLFIHAAGITDEQVSNDYDHAVFKSNDFIRYIVDGLGKTGCSQIVYISTIHVFGNLNRDLCEKTFCSPLSKYSELHHKTERLFEKLIGKYSMNYLTLRVPTIYGFPKD